jgi:dipeptidyl aminopeptidase/acylaminoacyl peptidase
MSVPIIPREVIFGNPDRASVQISPDGAHLSWLAALNGVLNVWVAPRKDPSAARAVTQDSGRGIRFYFWAQTSQHLLYGQDKNGDENWRIYAVDLDSGAVKDLTPFEGVNAQVWSISTRFPHEIVVGLNQRNPQWHDVFKINILSGEMSLLQKNNEFAGFTIDEDYNVREAYRMTPAGGFEIFKHTPRGRWLLLDNIPQADALTTGSIGFDESGKTLYMKDSRGRDTSALVALDYESGEKTVLAEDPHADASDVLLHPTQKRVQAVSFVYDRKHWKILDPALEPDYAYLTGLADGDMEIVSRSQDDLWWVILFLTDASPASFYLYDRSARRAEFLFTQRKSLEGQPLTRMHSAVIKSRDGLDLVVYTSLPLDSDSNGDGIPDQPLPTILNPHGGPWWRDFWGYNPLHQWMANRGYAVINVNFRSSTGFGKAFLNAGNLEWGGKVMEDQIDAVNWAISSGIADPRKVAVMGASFGGYSTLAGLTMYPEVFACGADQVGPVNLITLLESTPPYWKAMLEMFTTRVGDHRTEEGRALLQKHSPLTYVDQIRAPLLIGQGANDPRVKQAESDQIVAAMRSKGIPVTYVLYPDEGHGFARPENNFSFNAITEAFLARVLGGRVEPYGDDLNNSSLVVLTGAEDVPGLIEALRQRS